MFFLFFTTPNNRRRRDGRPDTTPPARSRVIVTWGLLGVWLLLMSFGVVSLVNPPWLQELSRPGIAVEAREYKSFGDDALHRGAYGSAVAQYEQALRIKPGFIDVMVNLAIAYRDAGDPARGARILQESLQATEDHSRRGIVYYNLGELLERQGRNEEAIEYYRQAIGYDIEQDLVHRKLGSLYLAARKLDKAREAFEMTLQSQTDPTLPYMYMLRRSVEEFHDDETHLPIIRNQLDRGVREEDLAAYELDTLRQMQERDPEVAKTHNHLGLIYAQLGNLAESIRHFERSLEVWPGNVDATRNLPILRRQLERQRPGRP